MGSIIWRMFCIEERLMEEDLALEVCVKAVQIFIPYLSSYFFYATHACYGHITPPILRPGPPPS